MLASAAPVSRRACTPGPGAVTLARAPARGCQRRPFSPDADGRPRTGCRRLPLACQPSRYTSARPGMTHRDGQSMRRRIKSTHNADSVAPGVASTDRTQAYRTPRSSTLLAPHHIAATCRVRVGDLLDVAQWDVSRLPLSSRVHPGPRTLQNGCRLQEKRPYESRN